MKNQLILGAIAIGVASVGFGVEKAQAFDLKKCNSNPLVVTGATDCEYVDPKVGGGNLYEWTTPSTALSDPAPGIKINVNNVNTTAAEDGGIPEGFFDITNWAYLGKQETGATSGSLNLTSLLAGYNPSDYNNLMAVFKGGNGTTHVGYLLSDKTTFAWTATPYNIAGDYSCTGGCGISHINFYGTKTPTRDVPTPAAVLPILGGLFGFASRRKQDQASV